MSEPRPDPWTVPPRLPLRRRLAVMAASGLATLAVAAVVFVLWGLWAFMSPGPAARRGAQTTVILRHHASVQEIANNLEDQGVVRSGAVFVALAQVTGAARGLKAGEYAFPSRAPLRQVLWMIRNGKIVHHHVTIPEGVTSDQAVAILMANDALTGSAPSPAEGSILPDTYDVDRGADRASVLQRMISAHDKLLAELWPHRRTGLPFKSPDEAIILASVVEKETSLASERPRVAAVFVNRLQHGVRLESDPTIIYGLTRGQPLGRGIRESELQAMTPYNTYRVAGLPPTPICNPGRASIAAVLDPPRTSELYFVADGTGGHAFSSSLATHQRNVARWRQIEQSRARAAAAATVQGAAANAPRSALRGEVRGGR